MHRSCDIWRFCYNVQLTSIAESQRKVSEDSSMGMSFCRKPSFILYMLTNLLYIIANFIPNGLLPETALSKGVTQNDISLTFSANGITQVIGRLMFGFLSHRLPHHIKYLWIIYLFGFGLSLLIVPLSTTFVHFFVYNLINGIFNGKYENYFILRRVFWY